MRSSTVTCFAIALAACTNAAVGPDEPDDEEVGDGTFVPVEPAPGDRVSPHLLLGVPSDATPDDDFLLVHEEMALGYSRFLNAASWVSWRTRPEDYGPAERFDGRFYPDDALPAGWYHADHADLYGSGYDRGHMVRSEERTRSDAANHATFAMTNVLPQRADLNRGPWFDFELYVQRRVQSSSRPRDAYVLAGGAWSSQCATHAPRFAGDGCTSLGQSSDPTRRIAVPAATWKVVVFVDAGESPQSASDPYVVAVLMPNERGIEEERWWTFRTSVAEIEARIGYDLPSVR